MTHIWRVEYVDLDEIEGTKHLAQFSADEHWNGWVVPSFDALACQTIVEELTRLDDSASWEWREDGALVMSYQDDYPPDVYMPDEDGLYALGARAWVWHESREQGDA